MRSAGFICISIADPGGAIDVESKVVPPLHPRPGGKLGVLSKWAHDVDAQVDLVQESAPLGDRKFWGERSDGGFEA